MSAALIISVILFILTVVAFFGYVIAGMSRPHTTIFAWRWWFVGAVIVLGVASAAIRLTVA